MIPLVVRRTGHYRRTRRLQGDVATSVCRAADALGTACVAGYDTGFVYPSVRCYKVVPDARKTCGGTGQVQSEAAAGSPNRTIHIQTGAGESGWSEAHGLRSGDVEPAIDILCIPIVTLRFNRTSRWQATFSRAGNPFSMGVSIPIFYTPKNIHN